jgi:hypothetical protein
MKKITLFIVLVVVFSCKKETTKPLTPEKIIPQTDNIIYSSAFIEPYLKFNAEYSEYELIKLKNPKSFSQEELAYPVKENEFEFNKSNDFQYYTTTSFNFNTVAYKVIAYTSYGENDSKVVNIQLNSYLANIQTDALLLDCRFTFETEYYRQFTIRKDGTIAIKKIAINGLAYDDEGDIIGQKKVKDTTTTLLRYKINPTGKFTKY